MWCHVEMAVGQLASVGINGQKITLKWRRLGIPHHFFLQFGSGKSTTTPNIAGAPKGQRSCSEFELCAERVPFITAHNTNTRTETHKHTSAAANMSP